MPKFDIEKNHKLTRQHLKDIGRIATEAGIDETRAVGSDMPVPESLAEEQRSMMENVQLSLHRMVIGEEGCTEEALEKLSSEVDLIRSMGNNTKSMQMYDIIAALRRELSAKRGG